MLEFLKEVIAALFSLALIAALLCGPVWGLTLLLLFSLGRFPDPLLCLLGIFAGIYLFGLLIAFGRGLLRAALYHGEKIGHQIWIWLL